MQSCAVQLPCRMRRWRVDLIGKKLQRLGNVVPHTEQEAIAAAIEADEYRARTAVQDRREVSEGTAPPR